MKKVLNNVLIDIIIAVFHPFWFAILLAFLFMFVYKQYPSAKAAIIQWFSWFSAEQDFRRVFLLAFYVAIVLFQTLLNRWIWESPLSKVWDSWLLQAIMSGDTKGIQEAIENIIMLIPFPILFFGAKGTSVLKKRTFGEILRKSTLLGFGFSLMIEILQLVLFLGTFQISDLVQNSFGGAMGGLMYYILSGIAKYFRRGKGR